MSDRLQKHFEEATNLQNNLKLLLSQWEFDKKLIPKALQAIGSLFPHYSRHDQSHSDQILVNIERLLGDDRIKLLSATDTWLLLEAAYWHDIGMVVTENALQEATSDPEFELYRQSVANSNGHELQRFAQNFGTDLSKAFLGADTPLDAAVKFRVFMAEWFRRKHASRSEKAVNNPWGELGLSSPRTELIPKRLFRLLGQVCALHGQSFEAVVSQLPFKEVGMANDDCHPRFVACLLRLGDLLDIDDNRFCPVMQRIAGGDRPALSKAHEDKHTSIRHFRLDTERIEVTAECNTVDGYVEQWRWLEGLQREVQKQMSRWQDIAPNAELGLLPTLGQIEVKLKGHELITEDGKRPEFSLNAERAIKLLQGENLYNRTDTVRELLQNAVDATVLRIWQTRRLQFDSNFPKKTGSDPSDTNYFIQEGNFAHPCFQEYPISFELERLTEPAKNPDKILWQLSIIDHGIGMEISDIHALMNVAGSASNTKRQQLTQSMPPWLRPSGNFGIGFQSVFMWTDEVKILTKSLNNNQILKVNLHNPTGPKRGLVQIEQVEQSAETPFGTKLDFILETENSGKRVRFPSYEKNPFSTIIKNYDILLDKDGPYQSASLILAADIFSQHSTIPVNWKYSSLSYNQSSSQSIRSLAKEKQFSIEDYFAETQSFFRAHLGDSSEHANFGKVLYRGQPVGSSGVPRYDFFNYIIDLHSDTASDWVTFNRNQLSNIGEDKIVLLIEKNFTLWVNRNINQISKNNRPALSAIAKLWSIDPLEYEDKIWMKLSKDYNNDWKNLSCTIFKNGKNSLIKYKDALKSENAFLHKYNYNDDIKSTYQDIGFPLINAPLCETELSIRDWLNNENHGIHYIIQKNHTSSSKSTSKRLLIKLIIINKGDRVLLDEDAIVFSLESFSPSVLGKERIMMPILALSKNSEFVKLILNNINVSGVNRIFEFTPKKTPYIILPFEFSEISKIKLDNFEKFIDWIHQNLLNPISRNEIKKIYENLIDYIDNDLMRDSIRWQNRRNPNVSSHL